jgi:F-type H+-transporting ATPase subunit a
MPPGKSWLSYIPGYEGLEHYFASHFHGAMGSHVIIQHLAAAVLVIVFMTILALIARGQLGGKDADILPDGKFSAKTIVEIVMNFVLMIMQFTMTYKTALKHFPVLGTLGFFILFSNLLGLIPGFLPPTENWNTTVACAIIVFVYYNGYGLIKLGAGHIAHMANPLGETWSWVMAPLFLPIELISHCIRPFSLSVRLLCNIAGDHMIMAVFITIFPFLLPLPFLGLGLFVSLLQVFVFLLLSSVYIAEVEDIILHHEHAHEHETQSHAAGAEAAAH